tara:strand:- start:2682 stop:3200 length:519 start_codon:yes stop_codon:yes gene_type:complete
MVKNLKIKPPNWPRELTFEEFKKLNPHINENQIINLYNQYLAKFLNELAEKKIHFKQSHQKNLQQNLNELKKQASFSVNNLMGVLGTAGVGGFFIRKGIGYYAVGTYLTALKEHTTYPPDEGFFRFTVGRPVGNPGDEYLEPPPQGLPGALTTAGYNAWLEDIGYPAPGNNV